MKIIITGSLGNISKPLTIALVRKKHGVTVSAAKKKSKKTLKL